MSGSNREDITSGTCKKHNIRTNREFRVCPSKLSKRELEDLYFTLLENNVDLKKTVNNQEDKIKLLSTKVQRMTAIHKNSLPKEPKDCCGHIKPIVNEYKESIADLKTENERMSERIRILNMRLCSAKQFARRSSAVTPSSYPKCSSLVSGKNSLMSIINTKMSDSNIRSAAVSSQCLEKDFGTLKKSVEIATNGNEQERTEKYCDENKCRTLMEELKQKITDLQMELLKTHEDYSGRISRLESEVSELRNENQRVRSECAASEYGLQQREQRADELASRLRTAEAQYGELAAQLSIEKRKVAELETRVKAVDMSRSVAKTIEDHLSQTSQVKSEILKLPLEAVTSSPNFSPRCDESFSRLEVPSKIRKSDASTDMVDQKLSDDSGYTDANKSHDEEHDKALSKINKELMERINLLQKQLTVLKMTAVSEISERADKEPQTLSSGVNSVAPTSPASPLGSLPTPVRTPTINFSCSSPVSSNLTVDNPRFDTNVVLAPEENKSELNDTNIKEGRDRRNRSDKPTIVCTGTEGTFDTTSGNNVQDYEVETTENEFMGLKKLPDINSNLEMNVPYKTSSGYKKRDSHNSYQIPGPMPIDIKTSKAIIQSEKIAAYKFKQLIDSNTKKKERKKGRDAQKEISLEDNKILPYKNETKKENISVSVDESKFTQYEEPYKGNLEKVGDKSTDFEVKATNKDVNIVDARRKSGEEKCTLHSERSTNGIIETPPPNVRKGTKDQSHMVDEELIKKVPEFELCSHYARVCGCPMARRRSVTVFRTCSGTLRFTTTNEHGTVLKQCGCLGKNNSDSIKPFDIQTETIQQNDVTEKPAPEDTTFRNRSATYTKGNDTYSVPQQCSRATSPDNTDLEISSLTDLPSERETKSPQTLSPGEDKATTTFTDSYTAPTTDYGSLSEGELPATGRERQSIGETKVNFAGVPSLTSQRMEEALQAIGEELARCRELLMSQRSPEPKQMVQDASLMTDDFSCEIPLKSAPATSCLGDSYSPKCVFTLHIGTVVLSDEAVINSRDLSMVLTWKFFDQNVSMTRMHAGRVVLFDFSTEYDLKVTPQFLDYLKYEEMPLIICELDKQSEPFASCTLPLRDALLHANRRADMSLALIAGPQLQVARATRDPLDSGDEVGVLDLWCMLRVDPTLLPAVNNVITRDKSPHSSLTAKASDNRNSTIQVLEPADDDPSTEYWLTRDFDKTLTKHHKRMSLYNLDQMGVPLYKKNATTSKPQNRSTPQVNHELADLESTVRSEDRSVHNTFARKFREDNTKETLGLTPRNEDDDNDQMSGIIVNEVPTHIKTANEMRLALNRSTDLGDIPPISRLHKMDDNILQRKNSANSTWRGLLTRRFSSRKRTSSAGPTSKKDSKSRTTLGVSQSDKNDFRTLDMSKKSVTIAKGIEGENQQQYGHCKSEDRLRQSLHITIMWLALNEECDAMANPSVQRLYVAYNFLGKSGAELETPLSLPKPKSYSDKCNFNFTKTFYLNECDLLLVGHMARCRSNIKSTRDTKDCIVFTVISEPPEDPLGLSSCEDIGYAHLYFGDLLAYSAGNNSYTEVLPVRTAHSEEAVCGVLAVKVDGLDVVRRCMLLAMSRRDLAD